MSPCAARSHQFFELEDLSYKPQGASFDRTGILVKCVNCGEERELWKGEEITVRGGQTVADTPEADTEHTIFITDAPAEE